MPLVSIWTTTYNHEKFIAKAIDGVLMQKVNFTYELVIGEDCSTDGTRAIVLAYKKKYPDKINLFLPEHNLGMVSMFKATYSLCTGRYVAWLDGDDYWTDPLKLQKQFDFLESNPDFVLCFHNIRFQDHIRNIEYDYIGPDYINPDNTFTIQHLLHDHNQIFTSSVFYRNVLGKYLPTWFYTLPFQDFGFYLLLIKHGKIKYLNEIMGVYRSHYGGAYSGLTKFSKLNQTIVLLKVLKENLEYLPKQKIDKIIGLYYYKLFKLELEAFNLKSAKIYFINILVYDISMVKHKKIEIAKTFFKLPYYFYKHIFSF